MTIANIDGVQGAVGPLKANPVIDITANDYEDDRGFIVQALTAGDLTYRTFDGDADQTETLVAAGFPNVCGVPVLCRAVRSTSTVTIRVGLL